MNEQAAQAEAHKILFHGDANNDGRIDYSEFIAAAMDKKVLISKERLKLAFQMFDRVSFELG